MGWLYMTNLKGHKTLKAYLDDQFTFAGERANLRVFRSALVQMKRYYAAVERIDESNKRHVFAIICLVNYNLRAKDGYIFGYKDMDESMGACETDCPSAILDLLTETESEYAKGWREDCRKRLQKKAPSAGETIVLAPPLKFTDGAVLSRFRIVVHQGRRRKKLLFQSEDRKCYQLRNLKNSFDPICRKYPPSCSRTMMGARSLDRQIMWNLSGRQFGLTLQVAALQVAALQVAALQVAALQVAALQVAALQVAALSGLGLFLLDMHDVRGTLSLSIQSDKARRCSERVGCRKQQVGCKHGQTREYRSYYVALDESN